MSESKRLQNPRVKPETFYLNISTADEIGIGLFKYYFYPEERFIIINSTFANLLQYSSKSELKKKKFGDIFVNGEDKNNFFRILQAEKKIKFFETTLKTKSEQAVWVAITASHIIVDKDKEYIEGIVENISTHKEMEAKLLLERDFLQSLLDNIPDAIYFKDSNNRIVKVNKFYLQGVGLKQEEVLGKTDFDFFPAAQAQIMLADDNHILKTGEPIVGKVERTLLPNGTWNQVITTKIPMHDHGGKIVGTMGITRDMTSYANMERERLDMAISALRVLSKALEMRDPYTFSHTRRVAEIAENIGRSLGWDENRLLGIRLAAELHDLGKISIPLDILNKPGKLSDLEYRLIQEHVIKCYTLIKDIKFPFPLAQTIYQHHERLDGSGYPLGLKGEDISLEARILAVSDVLEAMTHRRPYREAMGGEKAQEELRSGCGSKYDSRIVEIALTLPQ